MYLGGFFSTHRHFLVDSKRFGITSIFHFSFFFLYMQALRKTHS